MTLPRREIVERDESQLRLDARRLLRVVEEYIGNRIAEDPASSGTVEKRDVRRMAEAAAMLRETLYEATNG